MSNQYIILNDNKEATHGFKDGVGAKSWKEVKDFDNIGLIVPVPFIVLDFDTKSDADIMLKIIEDLDLKVRVMKTTRGIHVWFKSVDPWKCFKKTRLAIGIYSDCKSHSKNAYVKIKGDGITREWLKKTPFDEIEEVPQWLYPISNPSGKFEFKGMGDGDGRNQELFNYIVYLQAKGFKKDDIKETIMIINQFVLEDSLDEHEMSTILRDDAFKSDEEIEKQIEAKKSNGWSHNEFGDNLIDLYNILSLNGQLYIYEDGFYQQDERNIEKKMIDLYPSIKTSQRTEVLNYIRIKCHMNKLEIKMNPYIINLKNTRLDIRNDKVLPFDPSVIEFNRIPVTFDESAYCADLDKMLNKVFLGDSEVIKLFDEMLGYVLIGHCRYQKAFMFYGKGSNGKSTILNLIKKFIGVINYSTIELDKLTDRFATAELENKLVNVGDDINNNSLKDTGTIKKLISGESLQVERKQEKPFDLLPTAKHIYSCNDIPSSYDKSNGYYRRWCFIPFNANFKSTDEDYDPYIEDKITTEQALSYLLNRALRGVKRLIKSGKFTEPLSVKEALENYQKDNSTTLSWIDDKCISFETLTNVPCDELYSQFQDWCKLSGIKLNNVTGKKTFYKEIINKYSFEDKAKQKANGKRYFIVKLD